MNASGLVVPTVPQGDRGESTAVSPLPPSLEEASANPSSSSLTSPNSPSNAGNGAGDKSGDNASSPLRGDPPPSKEPEKQRGEDCGQVPKDPSSPEDFLAKAGRDNGGHRLPPPGRERLNPTRNWNTAYFQDEGGGDGPAYVEFEEEGASAYRDGSPPTPPALRWAESLQNLLLDESGEKVFRSYLLQEVRSDKILDFWYACRGLREYEQSTKNITELVSLIWKLFLRNKAVKISPATYEGIEDRIGRKEFDSRVFDRAQSEVEKEMNDTLYISFLKSEFYLSFLEPQKRGGIESPPSPAVPLEGCCSFAHCSNYLPTLHEDSEFDTGDKQPARLTSNNLLKSANYRANIERIKPEANAGYYLKGNSSYNPSPYHVTYISGHTVSLQDSELQSFSSGAHTDDTKSFTDSSVDGHHSFSLNQPLTRKELKRQNQRMKENALQNKEPPLISSKSGVHVIPRTMLNLQHTLPRADTNPEEFAKILCAKLEKSQQHQESKERLMHSMCKITHSEVAPEEARREHAVNALPPNVLLNKLNEKVLDDQGASQSILDEHVARVWDSPICSPSSPKQACVVGSPPHKGARTGATRQLPHLSYPRNMPTTLLTAHMSKCALKSGRHHTSVHSTPSTPCGGYPNFPQPNMAPRSRYPSSQAGAAYIGHIPHGYQSKNGYHGRRKERGQDVYSTFSSDSGNVPDYHDVQERAPSHLPKSKSMPEYIENHSVGATSDGASSGGRRLQVSGNRRCCRRPPADCTDSGVSVVSDSGRSGALSTSSERVESWLFQSRQFSGGNNTSYTVCPGVDRDGSRETQKVRGSKSTHTVAGSTSPGMQRRSGGGSSGRRSQCSSSTSGNTCVNTRQELTPGQITRPYELSRDSPLGQAQPSIVGERRKAKGGSSSSKSTGQSSSVGDGSGSNGSTLRKQQKSSKPILGETTTAPQVSSPAPCSAPADITTIVYSFQDDHVPFIIKVPSRPVTLKKFKQHLHKKGSFRYFFKKFCEEMGMVYEEITEDAEILPLFDGKVFVQIHKDD